MSAALFKSCFLAASLALGAFGCATPGAAPGGEATSDEAELFADFLAGTYASRVDDFDARTDYYSRAFARAPGDVFIGRRALTFAFLGGETERSRDIARDILDADPSEPMARMVLGLDAFADGRNAQAARWFAEDTNDFTMAIAMDLMRGWNAVELGDPGAARAAFQSLDGGPDFQTLAELQLAALDARQGDLEGALARLDTVGETDLYTLEAALARARILSDAGQLDEAQAALRSFVEENGDFDTGPVRDALARLEAGQPIEARLAPRQRAARALTEPSYSFFVRARALDAAELYLRAALTLDPDHDKAKIWLGNILQGSERHDEALALYRSVGLGSSYIVSARLAEAEVHFDRDADEAALAALEEANRLRPSTLTREALGRARLIRENYAEALPIYDALVASLSDEELRADPQPLYFRGIAREREGDFEAAVRDFKRVLDYRPDDADALNYLGYTWVDRGENLQEAFRMIERAVELEPDSGAIVDSLGWAHYKLGRYTEAKTHLERAVELSPGSATIVGHLGDVYWKLGRFREAGYQWSRALTLDPTDAERDAFQAKLADGLDAAVALSP